MLSGEKERDCHWTPRMARINMRIESNVSVHRYRGNLCQWHVRKGMRFAMASVWEPRCTDIRCPASVIIKDGCIRTKNRNYTSNQLSASYTRAYRRERTICNVSLSASSMVLPHLAASTWLFVTSTVYVGVLAFLMVLLPHWKVTQRIMKSLLSLFPLAIIYGILLTWSWQPDTFSLILPGSLADGLKGGWNPQFFPSITGISTLFSRPATSVSLWAHILAINVFAARDIYFDGLDKNVSTRHSVLCAVVLGPLGLLSHALTKFLFESRPKYQPVETKTSTHS